jgi:predicted GNAT family N-acyltransferase
MYQSAPKLGVEAVLAVTRFGLMNKVIAKLYNNYGKEELHMAARHRSNTCDLQMEKPIRELLKKTNASACIASRRNNRRAEVRIARSLDDLLMIFTIRASVYMAEQDCPFAEEFDGNDHCASHFIGFVEGEPAGCLRVRFFGGFAKLERLAVRKSYRKSTLAFDLVRAGIEFARRKGFTRIYGHSREGLDSFWARFGAKHCRTETNSCSQIFAIQK